MSKAKTNKMIKRIVDAAMRYCRHDLYFDMKKWL